jgi:hypothetical protein
MRNTLFGMLVVVCIFASGQADGAEKSAKIVDEKAIFALSDDVNLGENKGVGSMRLSPDGTKLLFIRRRGDDRKTRSYKLVLRDIKTGKDKELKLPGYDNDDMATFMVTGNVFGPAGLKVALGAGIDANKNGRHDFGGDSEKMQAVVYDLATDKMTKIGEAAYVALASFDRTGKGLVIINADKKAEMGKMFVTPLEKIKLRQLCLWGLPRGACPTADVMAVLLPPKEDPRSDGRRPTPAPKMVLLDLAKDKVLADVPLREGNTKLHDYCPQWTGDGRYLYYTSEAHEPEANGHMRNKIESRVWDREKKQLTFEVPATIPIGPGPTPTTMVLSSYPVTPVDKPVVHDAKADTTWTVNGPAIRLITSQGKYILYAKKGDDGKETLYRGKISLSTK